MTTQRDVPQFMHINSYARKPGKVSRGNGQRSASEIVAELLREPHASPHIANPRPPQILRGDPAKALLNAQRMAEEARDSLDRRLRTDAHILAGCVCSYPVPIAQLKDNPAGLDSLRSWIRKSIQWADSEFGEPQVGAIVLHVDETMPHLHMILTPPAPGTEPSPIRRAAKAAAAAKKDQKHVRKIERQAYKTEARRLQDSFFSAVSIQFGHTRHGRRSRPRLSPRERQVENSQALALSQALQRAAAVDELAKKRWSQLTAQSARLAQLETELVTRRSELQKWESALRARTKLVAGSVQSALERIVHKVVADLPNWLRPYGKSAAVAAFDKARHTVQSDLAESNDPGYSLGRDR